MNNESITSYMNRIDNCKKRGAINDMSVLAYQLVNELSRDLKVQEDAENFIKATELDTGLQEFSEQINHILTANPLRPLDDADKRLRDRMKENAIKAIALIADIVNAIARTVSILKQKVGALEGQLIGFHLKKPNVLEANDIYVSGIEFRDIGDPSVGIFPTNRLLKIDAFFDDQNSVKDFMVEIFDVWQKHVDGEPLSMIVIIFFGEKHGIESGEYIFGKSEQITHTMDWRRFRIYEPDSSPPPPPKPDHTKQPDFEDGV